MDIKISEVVKVTGGQVIGVLNENEAIERVSTDTRLVNQGDIFFAFTGDRFNAHDFIPQALEKGAKHFVVSDGGRVNPAMAKKANFILVNDTVTAYGDLARFYRQKFKIPAVTVTGSSGKTTVKELAAHLLSCRWKVLKNRGTENNLIGVPKTLFQLDASHEVIVLEAGTSCPGEIERLSSIASPQVGVLTLIGASHLKGLKTIEGVREEKLKIMQKLERGGTLVVNAEDALLKDVQSGVHKVLRVAFSKAGMSLYAEKIRTTPAGTSFLLNGEHRFETQLMGRHNVLNCLLALQCALSMGLDIPSLQRSLKEFRPVSGRLCPKNLKGIVFLDDSYNSNPHSFRAALETLKELKTTGKKGLVCGDMLELGEDSEKWHRQMGSLIAGHSLDYVVAAGSQSKFLVEEAIQDGYHESKIFHAKDSADAARVCHTWAHSGDLVLVKGSRGMQMEKVFECFTSSSTP